MKRLPLTTFALVSILLTVLCPFTVGVAATDKNDSTPLTGQIKINSWTLSNSSDEQIRIDTAAELLKNSSDDAREILLKALAASDNLAAQSSVCKAIAKSRSWPQLVQQSNDFIDPLMNIIQTQQDETAKLAAQASLIFPYKQIGNRLNTIIASNNLPTWAKLNAIYALQIRPDKEAVSELIDLLDNKDVAISSAASNALQEWLPLGNDRELWLKVLKDLGKKSRSDILRERLLAQQDKTRQLTTEAKKWKEMYIESLETIYSRIIDDTERAKFIAEKLVSGDNQIHLWAIEKINMWRKSGKPLPLEILAGPIIKLVSNKAVTVRLASAELLGMLTNVNSASALLEQLRVETNTGAKTRQLTALGRVCNYALSPGAEIKIDPLLRQKALDIAADFMKSTDPATSASAIGNLLMHNGMAPAQVKPYFSLMADYYKNSDPNSKTKAALLNEMARLCSSNSFYKAIAAETFRNIFTDEISSKDTTIAEPAVTGLSRIDPAGAFTLMKQYGFTRHHSPKIRLQLIETAGLIGTKDDLEWLGALADSAPSEDEKKRTLESMTNIFQYCPADVIFNWVQKFSQAEKTNKDIAKLAKMQSLLELAEKKAEAKKDEQLLNDIRKSMAEYYKTQAMYEPAARYFGILLQNTTDPNQQSLIKNNILQVHLSSGQIESAKQLLSNVLLTSDIPEQSPISKTLNSFFENNPEPNALPEVLNSLKSIKTPDKQARPQWQKLLDKWENTIAPPASPEPVPIAEPNSTETIQP
ncbi:MAG: hypothetical protein K8R02_02690 [Anaerohalosphaeraceae bacterium]|nr:hypothetical protein [Anaerohalosphaeraceae bacterium]